MHTSNKRYCSDSFGFVLMAILLLLPACTNGEPPQPPLTLPFEVQKAGNKVVTKLHVIEHREYIFSLRFGFKKNDQGDRARVKKLVGDDGQIHDGDPGIPTPLRFKIDEIHAAGERSLLAQEVQVPRLRSWGGDNFEKHVAYVVLRPGHYRVSVESLKDAPEHIGTPIALRIGFYAKATPIK